MTKLKAGDEVVCRVKDFSIVAASAEYDSEEVFEIIATDLNGYFLYVPQYYAIKNTIEVNKHHLRVLGVHKKYFGEQCYYISLNDIVRIKSVLDGCSCSRCGEFFPMAQPNQPDGSMLCFLCRTYKYR